MRLWENTFPVTSVSAPTIRQFIAAIGDFIGNFRDQFFIFTISSVLLGPQENITTQIPLENAKSKSIETISLGLGTTR